LAREFARIEAKYPNPLGEREIYELLKDFKKVVPQGSPMSGVGNPYQLQSLSNCFVVDSPHDSYSGILFTDQEQVQIMKRRGGVGFDISPIRPRGMLTTNAARTTDGIGVFMERFSNSTREVAQGGRRGALMLSIHCFEGSTLVLTEAGWKRIDDVVDNKFTGRVWTHEGWKEIDAYQKFEDSEIYEVEAENGKTIKVTADHKFVVKNTLTGEEYLKAIKEIDVDVEELVFYDVSF
jgi:ribonucleotide reductase alpha subunit